ncbi:formylglycine-generating enzyme family protein [Nibricoccus aquaticus]|nr:formylglycine-generating enzyme family protein [Nibricoccus aquaticus]
MALIPSGTFSMGSDAAYSFINERPSHEVTVRAFFIAINDVTNAQFAKFVTETHYVTVAERPINWEEMKKQVPPGTPKPRDEDLQPGSLVFKTTEGPVDLSNMANWWVWTLGASWKHPEGPDSTLEGRENHPVVHIAYEDAVAYAKWAKGRLPTEAEWEFAARGGLVRARFAWGDGNPHPAAGRHRANTWTGNFPWRNTTDDGYAGTSPAGSFPPNSYGLYDMGGNVWNWCSDIYAADTYTQRADHPEFCSNPSGPSASAGRQWIVGDPSPAAVPGELRHVIKGGSFLCAPSYCESYRPSARRGSPPDTSTSHIGFRIVMDLP